MVKQAGQVVTSFIKRFAVKRDGRIVFVDVHDVDWIEGAKDYVRLHVGNRAHLIRGTMKSIADGLDPADFVRIHRSAIVRVDRIKELSPRFHGTFAVTLLDGTELQMSRRYRRSLRRHFGYGF